MIRNSDKISIHMFSDIILIPTVKDYWIGVNVLIIASMDIFRKKVVNSTHKELHSNEAFQVLATIHVNKLASVIPL